MSVHFIQYVWLHLYFGRLLRETAQGVYLVNCDFLSL